MADGVWCDCHSLRDAVRGAGEPCPVDLPKLRRVLALYTADAFRGCYDDWALDHRQRLRQEALLGYERLVERASAAADWDLTLEAGLSGIALDPLMESFHRGVILAHGHRGNPAAAIRQFTRIESLLSRELRLRPSAATREVLSQSLTTAQGDGRLGTRPR
jgi:DNA-binding SARP family transcriptional activator